VASITYGVLRSRVLDAADMQASAFPDISSSGNPLKLAINESIASLYDLLLDIGWQDAFTRTAALSVTTVTDEFAAPADCYKPIRLIFEDTDGTWYPLDTFSIDQIHDNHVNGVTIENNYDLRWAPWSTYATSTFTVAIKFSANPPSTAGTFRLYYVPALATIGASDLNPFPFVVPASDCAAYLLRREESDPSGCEQRRAEIEQRIRWNAKSRQQSGPGVRMIDVNRRWWR
jgi:hypothetical protein